MNSQNNKVRESIELFFYEIIQVAFKHQGSKRFFSVWFDIQGKFLSFTVFVLQYSLIDNFKTISPHS
jgi:hypothetical protein